MSAISAALGAGHNAQSILRYLSQHNPRLAQQISAALNAGHTIDHVLNFMSRNEKRLGKLIPEQKKGKPAGNLFRTASTSVHPALERAAKGAAMVAGGAALAGAASSYGPMLAQALGRAAPQLAPLLPGGGGPPGAGPAPGAPNTPIAPQPAPSMAPIPGATSPLPTGPGGSGGPIAPALGGSPLSPVPPQAPQLAPSSPSPAAPQQSLIPPRVLKWFSDSQAGTIAKNVLANEKDPKVAADTVRHFFPKEAEETEKQAGAPLENVMSEMAQDPALMAESPGKIDEAQKNVLRGSIMESPIEQEELPEPKPIAKADTVATPQGIGNVREIRGDKALVEVNGKLQKVPVEDLEPEPEGVRNSKITMDLSKVPEDMRSSVATMVHYPKSRSDITLMPGLSEKIYRYTRKDGQPFDEDMAKSLTEEINMPISEGDEFMGAWSPGGPSRGTTIARQLVNQAQKIGESDDPSKPYWFEEIEDKFLHGYLLQFFDALKEGKEHFDRDKAKKDLASGKRKRARKDKDIERRF